MSHLKTAERGFTLLLSVYHIGRSTARARGDTLFAGEAEAVA